MRKGVVIAAGCCAIAAWWLALDARRAQTLSTVIAPTPMPHPPARQRTDRAQKQAESVELPGEEIAEGPFASELKCFGVVDAITGETPRGARAWVMTAGGRGECDPVASGRVCCEFEGPNGFVEVLAPGYAREFANRSDLARISRVDLDRGLDLAGRVEDERGRPVAGAIVCSAADLRNHSRVGLPEWAATTDHDGRFRLEGLRRSQDGIQLVARHPDYAETSVEVGEFDPARVVVIALGQGCALIVNVKAPDGLPAAGASVAFVPEAGRKDHNDFSSHPNGTIRTDASGTARFDRVACGGVIVAATPTAVAKREIVLDRASETRVELPLAAIPEISGSVVDEQDRPVAGAAITAQPIWDESSAGDPMGGPGRENAIDLAAHLAGQVISAKDGTFRINGRFRPSMRVTARLDQREAVAEAASGSTGVVLRLTRMGSLVIELVGERRGPITLFAMDYSDADPENLECASAICSFPALRAGPWQVMVGSEGRGRVRLDTKIFVGEVTTEQVNVPPAPDARVAGTVVDEEGHPISGAAIDIEAAAPRMSELSAVSAEAVTDGDGRFSIERIAGPATIGVFHPGFTSAFRRVAIGVGTNDLGAFLMVHGKPRRSVTAFSGVGMRWQPESPPCVVAELFADSPAERGGVQVGDIVIGIDGVDVSGEDTQALSSRILGEPGTRVDLALRRGNRVVSVSLARALVIAE